METLLVDEAVAEEFLPTLLNSMRKNRLNFVAVQKPSAFWVNLSKLRPRKTGTLNIWGRSLQSKSLQVWMKQSNILINMAHTIPMQLLPKTLVWRVSFSRVLTQSVMINASTRFADGF